MDAGGNITLDGKASITIKVGGNSIVIDQGSIKIVSNEGTIDLKTLAGALGISGKSTVKIDSDGTVQSTSKGPTSIKGADVEINKG
jgi:uncharacterized protein (DUF2345 family)